MSTVTAVPIPPVKRNYLVWLWIGIAAALAAAAALVWAGQASDPATAFLAKNRRTAGVVQTASGLQYKVLTPGKGAPPTDTDVVLMNYEGRFLSGEVFDKSPRPVPLPVNAAVPGFTEALKLMPKGAKYRLWIKPSLGYGAPRPAGAPPMDPQMKKLASQVLVFDVELLDYLPEAVIRQMQMQQQMMGGGMPGGAGAPPGGAGAPPAGAGTPPGQ